MAFSFFFGKPNKNRPQGRQQSHRPRRPNLGVETLEDRTTPTAISGYVYHDANNNGTFDLTESPIPGVAVQLKSNTTGQIVANAITDSNGFYQFTKDDSVNTTPTSITKTVSFPETDTNFDLTGVVDKFDSSLGTLNSIDIIHDGSITSSLQVENTSRSSSNTITGTVGGSLTLIAPGINDVLTMSQNAGSITVGVFDNLKDFAGTSGGTLGTKTATASKTTTITGAALAQWQGAGTVTLQSLGTATSSASGGGNVLADITSSGRSTITVRYNYTPGAGLKPGPYTVIETQPTGYQDGLDARGGVPIPGSNATDVIELTLSSTPLVNNNFGELQGSSISGYVYLDANNNGIKEAGEAPISGVIVTLTGFTTDGPVNQTATTDANGFYQFSNLKPGTYGLAEGTPGAQYLDGKDTIGSQGGTVANDAFSSIVLNSGANGVNNNFGELLPAKISGKVYFDVNANSVFDSGDSGISGVTVTLTGADDQGPVSKSLTTDASGNYSFTNLRPGTYTVTETQPANYKDGAENLGTVLSAFAGQTNSAGTAGNDVFTGVALAMGATGENFNFGELKVDDGDVGILKTSSASQIYVGDTLTYTVTVTNNGPGTAANLTVTDVLPSGTTLLSAVGSGWTVFTVAGGFNATLPSLAVGASSVITVQIRVPAVASAITNTVTVTTTTTDNNPNNNTSSVTTNVLVRPVTPSPLVGTQLPPRTVPGKDLYLASSVTNNTNTNNQNAAVVNGLYQTILNRVPDIAGLTYFANQMSAGMTVTQIANTLLASDERRGLQADRIYQTALGRAPNASERAAAINTLKAGASEATIERQLYTSAEFNSLNPTSASFYGGLHLAVTGALPSASAAALAVQTMSNSPLDQVVASLQQSDDALRQVIRGAYLQALRRHASTAEVDHWLGQMKSASLTKDALLVAFFNSAEFQNLAKNAK